MAKPDPALLTPNRYPFSSRIDPRFADLDFNLHLNNVAMAGLLEDARVRFHRASGYGEGLQGLRSVVASITIDYLGEGAYPEPVTIHTAIDGLGRSSHTVVQLAMQGEQLLAFARTVLVALGPDGPAPLPRQFAEASESWTLRA